MKAKLNYTKLRNVFVMSCIYDWYVYAWFWSKSLYKATTISAVTGFKFILLF